jgi:type III restriction enzyme
VQELRSGQGRAIGFSASGVREPRSEDYIISGLIDLDDISYDDHAPLLQELPTQTVEHFWTYLDEDQTDRVLRVHQKQIAHAIAAQMRPHYWTKATGFETTVSRGFTPIRGASYTHDGETRDFRQAPPDKSKYRSYLFGGYRRCLVTPVRFDSDAERVLSIILDRESLKWFKPASGQF